MLDSFLQSLNLSLKGLIHYLPSLIGGVLCFVATLFLANFLSKTVSKYSLRRTKDGLISNFIGKIVWTVFFILGTVLTLGILGLGTISNKILAGAGITTFVVGFALKDIGENFLSGLILAFSRPFKVGNLIECSDVKGVVRDMTLRQTTIESDDGKIILVPNSMIINNPLSRYFDDDDLDQEFSINVDIEHAAKAKETIPGIIDSYEPVFKKDDKQTKVIVDSLNGDKLRLKVIFWLDVKKIKGSRSELRSSIMLHVFEKLTEAGVKFSG